MARSIWTGTITFGLVSVPVKLYSAIQQKDVHFNQLEESTGARIHYKRVSEKTGREVPYEKIAKGYELDKGRYVLIAPEELEKLDPKATREIEIEDFVDLDQIDPIFFEHAYYLAPGTGGEKAYALLTKALEDTNKVGIARVVIRTKQYLAAVRPKDGALMLETMLYADEVVPMSKVEGIPAKSSRVNDRELRMAKQLIDALSVDFKPEKYKDEYRNRVLDYIKKKAKGRTIEMPEAEERPKVADLMEALKASVEGMEGGRKKKTSARRKAPAHKATRKKSARRKTKVA
ncbi:MAG: Ku protein [Actinomycetota bacterium]|nr:Ku protein [Actinomycetota bacterium]